MAVEWEAQEGASGTFDLFRDRRIVFYDMADLDAAVSHFRRAGVSGDTLIHVHPDGYRERVKT